MGAWLAAAKARLARGSWEAGKVLWVPNRGGGREGQTWVRVVLIDREASGLFTGDSLINWARRLERNESARRR